MDRIIVESNERMGEIIQWTKDNTELINQMSKDIPLPFEKGIIEFQGELIELGFEVVKNTVKFNVWMNGNHVFDFEKRNKYISKPIFPPGLSKEQRQKLAGVVSYDNTTTKLVFKYEALMIFSALHRETIVLEEQKRTNKGGVRKVQPNVNKVLQLAPKRYIISYVPKEINGHRAYTEPDHAVEVRPTVRHLKSGKIVPVKGFTKYKDKQRKEQNKVYKA